MVIFCKFYYYSNTNISLILADPFTINQPVIAEQQSKSDQDSGQVLWRFQNHTTSQSLLLSITSFQPRTKSNVRILELDKYHTLLQS